MPRFLGRAARCPPHIRATPVLRPLHARPFSTMGDNASPAAAQPPLSRTDSPATATSRSSTPNAPSTASKAKRPVRILMLHGYTQSGPLFRAKTRALEKLLVKTLAPAGLLPAFVYPTAPNRLSVRDVPGYEPPPSGGGGEAEHEIDSWAWFRKDEASGRYRLLADGMGRLAEVIAQEGASSRPPSASSLTPEGEQAGIDGVIGFSQGGCMAAMLAAALEGVGNGQAQPRTAGAGEHEGWVRAVREANGGRPLRFAVIYSGFRAAPDDLAWLYEPRIRTPTMHFLGSLDTVVDESRSQALVERCEDPVVLTHPGGHYVPINKEWVMPLAGFIKKCLEQPADGTNKL